MDVCHQRDNGQSNRENDQHNRQRIEALFCLRTLLIADGLARHQNEFPESAFPGLGTRNQLSEPLPRKIGRAVRNSRLASGRMYRNQRRIEAYAKVSLKK
jgi:hypothetical protein